MLCLQVDAHLSIFGSEDSQKDDEQVIPICCRSQPQNNDSFYNNLKFSDSILENRYSLLFETGLFLLAKEKPCKQMTTPCT
jgi:hypothetical protein